MNMKLILVIAVLLLCVVALIASQPQPEPQTENTSQPVVATDKRVQYTSDTAAEFHHNLHLAEQMRTISSFTSSRLR
ncbi:MAG: hypothetical protein ACTSXD_08395 [Candidatus Heimdallarchaeaceae archaeon]